MIYLASPYLNDDPNIVKENFYNVTTALACLKHSRPSEVIFSPIVHCHPIYNQAKRMRISDEEIGWMGDMAWTEFNRFFMDAATELWILDMEEWGKSSGIKKEIDFFIEMEKPIKVVTLNRFRSLVVVEDFVTVENALDIKGPFPADYENIDHSYIPSEEDLKF